MYELLIIVQPCTTKANNVRDVTAVFPSMQALGLGHHYNQKVPTLTKSHIAVQHYHLHSPFFYVLLYGTKLYNV
jgi:hypothetical protein